MAEGLLDESILTGEAVMPATADAAENRVPRGNLRRAAGLLEEAGWAVGDSGFLPKRTARCWSGDPSVSARSSTAS